jgi:hypothetical protein
MQCVFCHKDSTASKSVEHIIPESLGNKHYFLSKGYVCDGCNNYFAVKIERELLEQPYFKSMRFRNEILTKKGKPVKEKMIFPGAMMACDVEMHTTDSGPIMSFNDELLYEAIKEGKTHTMISPYCPEPDYPSTNMSRFIAKCAYEYFLYNVGEENYESCVQELLGDKSDVLKDLREYARYGKGPYWHYNQRRIYSEGACFVHKDGKECYEILHEMKFFTKEYKRYSSGLVEAEIYFVMAIAGIEYAMCISDPSIIEYQKWIKEHNGISPLNDKDEVQCFSLSDVNPLLIGKDARKQ